MITHSNKPLPGIAQWTNVTLVVSSSAETMSIYINGALAKTTTGLTGDVSTLYSSTQTFGGYIGKSVWGGDPYLNATVDDFRVYNSALTATQIAAVASNAPVSPATANPVTVSTAPGSAPALPSTVNVPSTDGTNQALPVTWASIDPSQYAAAGSFTVAATTSTTPSLTATATVYVLPKPALTLGAKTGTSISLNWAAEDGATAYTLSRSTTSGSGYTQVYTGTDTSFADSGLSLSTTYYYILSYTVSGGGTSLNSAELPVKTDTVLVGPPTVSQDPYLETNRISLTWNAVDLADSYNIYRSATQGGTYALLTNTTATSYADNAVDQGSTYYYEVACLNDAGEGPLSAPLAAQTAVDTVPPTTVTSSAQTDSTITLNWVGVAGATNYNLYRTTTSGSGYSQVYSGTATTFKDTNLVTGTTYFYVVTYTDSLGTSINSKELTVSTVAVKVPAPSSFTLVGAYPNAVALGWNSVVGAKSFNLYRSDTADGTYALVNNTTGNTYTNVGLTPGTTYYYEASSVNAAGESALSAPFKVTTDPGTNTVVTNSTTWLDDDGNPIQAGSGDILQVGSTYYWYGTGGGPYGINVYSSADLVHWKFENQILSSTSLDASGQTSPDLNPSNGNHFERPKVIYDAATQEYVLLAHYDDSNYDVAKIAFAYSSTPTGNFTWSHVENPAGLDARDMTAFVDTDGTGYVVASTGGFDGPDSDVNSHLTLFQLAPDDLSVAKQMYNIYGGANNSGIYTGREAPALVNKNGYYYLVTSQAAGWYPSDAMYSVAHASSLANTTAASWTGSVNVDAASGWDGGGFGDYLGDRSDFGGQSVYIVPITGTHGTSYILMNDTLDPKASGVGGPLWLPLQLDNGVASIDYSAQININAKAGEVTNVYPGSLLSQGKPATASSASTTDSDGNVNPSGWTAGYADDGNYNTEWISSGSTYPAWWEVDLGQEYSLSDVELNWWLIGGSEATQDFQIQVSDDGTNWSVAYDLSSGDKKYGFNDVTIPNVEGRYVRVWIIASHTQNNNGGWYVPQLYEVKVYGNAAPTSATITTPDSNGNYKLAVPSNIDNYPATGTYTMNLGNVSAGLPIADLLSNLGHGTLTAGNDVTTAATKSAITAITPPNSTVADTYNLDLTSADGTVVHTLDTPAPVTVNLSPADITALSNQGVPALYYYNPSTNALVTTDAVFDLAAGTVTYNATQLGTYVLELTNIPAKFTVKKAPVVNGTAQVGKTLTATAGTYSVSGVTTTYQWLRNGTPIGGATSATYTATGADYQATLSAQVTASKLGYSNVTVATAATGAVAVGTFKATIKPAIDGTLAIGATLSLTTGSYSITGVGRTYQWLRGGTPIQGAINATYTITSADSNAKLSAQVTASATGYTAVITTTAQTGKIK